MSRQNFARLCLYAVALGFVATGLLYMLYGSPMPYHLDAMQTEWAEIPPQQRLVITAIQRGAASGFLAGGIAIFTLAGFALGTAAWAWARWCILVVGMVETLPAIHSVCRIKAQTPGEPPLAVLLVFTALVIVGVTAGGARPGLRE